MAAVGTIGVVLSAIGLLKEVLEKAGLDSAKVAQIIGEFVSKLKTRAGRADGTVAEVELQAAVLRESWEYSVLTLAREKSWKRPGSLVVKLRNGNEIPAAESRDLAAHLDQASEDGWEIVWVLGGEQTPTLILRRPKHPAS